PWQVNATRNPVPRDLSTGNDHEGSAGRRTRLDFVEFRHRLQRLVDALVALRDLTPSSCAWPAEHESVEVTLESTGVVVELLVAQMPWEMGLDLIHRFQVSFGKFAPVFLASSHPGMLKVGRARQRDGGYAESYIEDNTTLWFRTPALRAPY